MITSKTSEIKKIFAVPYNGTSELVNRVIDAGLGEHTYEFYGTDGFFASGRPKCLTILPDKGQFESDINLMAQNNIKFDYLFNSLHVNQYLQDTALLEDRLKYIRDIGVEVLTVAHPVIAQFIKSKGFSFEIKSSLNSFVNSVERAKMFIKSGYDALILDEDELRNIPLLRKIVQKCDVTFEVIVNNLCTRGCIHRFAHQAVTGNPDIDSNQVVKMQKIVIGKCHAVLHSDLNMLLSSSWIRPEDINQYLDIGISLFKLTGRLYPTDDILKSLASYAKRAHSGNIFDYLPSRKGGYPLKYGVLDSKYVEPYFEHIWNEKECERDDCPKCQAISDQIAKFVKKRSGTKLDNWEQSKIKSNYLPCSGCD
jgi:collagenase-like PrtC family protease